MVVGPHTACIATARSTDHPASPSCQERARAKFDETVDLAVNLGTDPRKGDQMVRGVTVLPHGTGRAVRVGVFAQGEAAEAARQAGACTPPMWQEGLAEQQRRQVAC